MEDEPGGHSHFVGALARLEYIKMDTVHVHNGFSVTASLTLALSVDVIDLQGSE